MDLDDFDDNHTTQPGPRADRKAQSVKGNHRPNITVKAISVLAATQVTAMAPTCNIAAGVPEWSSDTCCPITPSWHQWAPPPISCVHAETPPLSIHVCDFDQEHGMYLCPTQTQLCNLSPTCIERDCVTPLSPHAWPHVTPSPEAQHDTCGYVWDRNDPSCTCDSCMCNDGSQPLLGDDPYNGYPQWNHARVTQCYPHSICWPVVQCPGAQLDYVAYPLNGDSSVMLGGYFSVGFSTSAAQCWGVHNPLLRCHCVSSLTMDMPVTFHSHCHCCGTTPKVHLDCPTSPSVHDVSHAISEQACSPPLHTATRAFPMDDDKGDRKKSHEEWSPPDFSVRDDDMPDFDGDAEVKEDSTEQPEDKKDKSTEVTTAAKAADDAEGTPNPNPEAKAEASVQPGPEHLKDKAATARAPTHVHADSVEAPESLASVEPPESLATKPDI
eukprot:4772571-Amphidinium_carterae.1